MKCRYCDDETRLYQIILEDMIMKTLYFPICEFHRIPWYKIHELPSYIPEIQEIAYLRQLEAKDKNNIYLKQTGL
jgi:hypothetical protein